MKRVLLFLLFGWNAVLSAQSLYLEKALSANDHKRSKPLEQALAAGCAGVSIKLKLDKGGVLRCGSSSFEESYIKPLKQRAEAQNGWTYAGKPEEFYIFSSIDGDSMAVMEAIVKLCDAYPNVFSGYEDGKRVKHTIRWIVSGDIPKRSMAQRSPRYYNLEEAILKPEPHYEAAQMGFAWLPFGKAFSWNGEGNMPNMAYMSFVGYMKNAHKAGRLVRIVDAPEKPNAWGILIDGGADFIEIEDFEVFTRFWRNRKPY